MITAIVLAGGRSTRFGADKLAATLVAADGRPRASVLAATIRSILAISDSVVVAGAALPADLEPGDVPVELVADAEPFGGPLVALARVLERATPAPWDLAIVVGGDMPRLVPGVLIRMTDVLDVDPSVDAVYLGAPRTPAAIATSSPEPPRRQVLPLAIRVQPAARAAREAVQAGRRSLQALVDALAAVELPSAAWLPLDPVAATLTDIDTRTDLDRQNAT